MSRSSRRPPGRALSAAVAFAWWLASLGVPGTASGFDRFTDLEADATFGDSVTFSVELVGGEPDELELLLTFGTDDATFVQPVEPDGDTAEYVWDAAEDYIAPNTPIRYRWRATDGDEEPVVSAEESVLYDDDRPHLDWQIVDVGQARVHWYGDEEAIAQRLGRAISDAVARSEELFGAELGRAVDIFLYREREDFFGAIEPAAREWVGGEARSEIRTIYAWLEAEAEDRLELLLIHEVAHMVFADATDNPFHEPARWVNEGLATWTETRGAERERSIVESAASDGRLTAFDAIAQIFPAGRSEAEVAYAQSATLMDDLITTYGADSIARMTAAYREGATDAEAIEAATGDPLDDVLAEWFARYGQDEPEPVEPEPLLPAETGPPEASDSPDAPTRTDAEESSPPDDEPASPAEETDDGATPWLLAVIVGGAIAVLALGGVALKRATSGGAADGHG